MRRRLAGTALALVMVRAAAADPLAAEPSAAASAEEAVAAAPARRACQAMVVHLNRGAETWDQVRRGAITAAALRAQLAAAYDNGWRAATGGCNVALAELPGGRAQEVLVYEQELALGLHGAQRAVLAGWAEGQQVDEIDRRVAAWEAALLRWTDWYGRAEGFWAAGLLSPAADRCLTDRHAELRRLSVQIWQLAALTSPPADDVMTALRADAVALGAALDRCASDREADRVEQRHLRLTLEVLTEALAALPGGDVVTLRGLQAREQAALARQLRCRQEQASGRPGEACVSPP